MVTPSYWVLLCRTWWRMRCVIPEHTKVDIWVHRVADQLLVEVTDQGVGIPEDEQKRYFERFIGLIRLVRVRRAVLVWA